MSLEIILNKLNFLEKKINEIDEKLDNINYKIDNNLINNCEKMGGHVDFVEKVYDSVKNPLQFISNTFSNTNKELPDIKSQKNLQLKE